MPDPILMLQSLATAVAVATVVVIAGRFLDRRWAGVIQAVATAAGAAAGLTVLGVRPKWPMREDQDRLLGLILPAVLILEAALARFPLPRQFRSIARLVVTITVAPTLLSGSIYVTDMAGPGTAEWGSPPVRFAVLGGLGLALFGVWSSLDWASKRSDSAVRTSLPLATAVMGAGVVVMLSGYASGGMNGFPLAGAIAGAALASGLWKGDGRDAIPGVGAVTLFGLLLSGYCFGELKSDVAWLLFLAPLLAIAPEAPPIARRGRPWLRTGVAFVLVGLVVGGAVGLTGYRFQAAATESSTSTKDSPSVDDYLQYR